MRAKHETSKLLILSKCMKENSITFFIMDMLSRLMTSNTGCTRKDELKTIEHDLLLEF